MQCVKDRILKHCVELNPIREYTKINCNDGKAFYRMVKLLKYSISGPIAEGENYGQGRTDVLCDLL